MRGSVRITTTLVRSAAKARRSAASSSAMPSTCSASAPRLAACAPKSTVGGVPQSASRLLNGSPPVARCNRSMQPKPPLSSTTMVSFRPSITEVAISEFSIR